MTLSRRRFLFTALSLFGLKIGFMLGLISLTREAAAGKSASDPEQDRFQEAMELELRGAEAVESPAITLEVPGVAEDGAIVPIMLESRIAATDRLVLFVEKNPFPLIAAFEFADRAAPSVSLRIKMNESSAVVVLARARGKYYRTVQWVRVVRGGCG